VVDFSVYTGAMSTFGTLDVLTRGVTEGPYTHLADFQRLWNPASKDYDPHALDALPRPVVRMSGSSTEQDLDGDVMYLSAIQDMTKADANLSICLNHSYNLPEDLYGSMVGAPWTKAQGGITDLWLQSDVEVLNPRAAQTYLYTVRGRRIGVSGGFMVLEAEWIDRKTLKPIEEKSLDMEDLFNGDISLGIKRVKAVEWSTVTIPSNQRSWVEQAVKGLFQRTGNPTYAPLVRRMYPQSYHAILAETNADPWIKARLEDVAPRKSAAPAKRVLYLPNTQDFQVDTTAGARMISRDALTALLTRSTELAVTSPAPAPDTAADTALESAVATPAVEADLLDKNAGGKATWPLGERERAWDEAEAHARILDWAGGGSDGFSPAKMKSVHFYFDAETANENVTAYKLLFCDVVDGEVHAIPRAIMACTGAHGVDAADILDDDKAAIQTKIERYYARMREAFDDETLIPSWQRAVEESEKGDDADMKKDATTGLAEAAPSLEASTDPANAEGATTAPDTKDEAPDATKAETKAALGPCPNCEKVPGADHDGSMRCPSCKHCLSCGAAVKPSAMKCKACGASMAAPKDGEPDDEKARKPIPAPSAADDDDDEEEKSAGGEKTKDAPTTTPVATAPATAADGASAAAKSLVLEDGSAVLASQRATLLRSYNEIGSLLGFGAVSVEPTASKSALFGSPEDAQRVVTLVSEIDRIADALCRVNTYQLDVLVDELMQTLRIPDIDAADLLAPVAEDSVSMASDPASVMAYISAMPTTRKAGARHSARDIAELQALHDGIMRLTDGSVCRGMAMEGQGDNTPEQGGKGASDEDARAELDGAKPDLGADTHATRAALPDLVKSLQDLTGGLAGINVKALETSVDALETRLAVATTAASRYETHLDDLIKQEAALRESISALGNMPLGRPTSLTRTLDMDDPLTRAGVATYEDMRAASHGRATSEGLTLEDALARTKLVSIDGVLHRHWPEGVAPNGGRPELSTWQKVTGGTPLMRQYRENQDCYVREEHGSAE
jgi:hypothetical protein